MNDKASLALIFRRGGQKQEVSGAPGLGDSEELDRHLQQLAQAWAAPKAARGLAAAVWRPAVGAFEVLNRGRQTFNGQGFVHKKRTWLNIEEALFMLDQAEAMLFVEEQQQQQQQAGQQQHKALQRLLSMQEAQHMMVELGVAQPRLLVLSHLCRLGYIVRRHPACWQVGPQQQPAASWQINPAWAATDGLLPPSLSAAPAPAAAPPSLLPAPIPQPQQQQQPDQQGDLEQQQAKRRRTEDAAAAPIAAGSDDDDEQQQQQQGGSSNAGSSSWFARVPPWLEASPAAAALLTAPNAQPVAATATTKHHHQQQQAVEPLVPQLLGLQLRQRFPGLAPLPTYRPMQQAGACGVVPAAGGTADLVFDALVTQPRFSYKRPPVPSCSIAMARQGAASLPCLDELLRLSDAAAGPATTATGTPAAAAAPAGGLGKLALGGDSSAGEGAGPVAQRQRQQDDDPGRFAAVRFAVPDGGDVSFYEVQPVVVMDLLTNRLPPLARG